MLSYEENKMQIYYIYIYVKSLERKNKVVCRYRICSSKMKKTLPHDQSSFFSSPRYQKALEKFLEYELENDGEDLTSRVFLKEEKGEVFVIAKENGVLAGKEELDFFLQRFFPEISYTWTDKIQDGEKVEKNQKILTASGESYSLMKMERVFLNILSRMSGIATQTQKLSEISGIPIAATRKTQWSYFDKKAVYVGGGLTHRMGLFDAIMLKENHLFQMKNTSEKIQKFLEKQNSEIFPQFLEIEIETPAEFQNIFSLFWNSNTESFPKVIMLDNFSPAEISQTLAPLPEISERHQKNIFLEASGGISEHNIEGYTKTGVDVISMGSLTNSVVPLDFSMRSTGTNKGITKNDEEDI